MTDRELENGTYSINPKIINYVKTQLIKYPTEDGIKRAKNIIKNNGRLSGFELKRLKNFFDTFNSGTESRIKYELAGGDLMKQEVEHLLNSNRVANDQSKKVKQMYSVDPMLGTKPTQTPRLNEDEKKKELTKNAVAVIVDDDNKILLLKRGNKAPWQPLKWSLVGGAINKDETPKQAIEREILEETGLEIEKFIKTFDIQRNPDSIEHIFACRYNGDPTDIKLNGENSNYGWYDIDEMAYLEIVPNLIEYITLAFTGKEYED
jgi:8-oxo-dGTP pyrophosphatase MutT (NUDIX family)